MHGEAWEAGVRMDCNRSFTNTYIKVKKTHHCSTVFIQQINAVMKGQGEKVMHKEKAC